MHSINSQPSSVEPQFAALYGFGFDDFQIEAIDHIRAGDSVMVAAPTSSGKTVVAEYGLWRSVQAGRRAVYTTPIKALSNQKRKDLERLFPGKVGLLTGDRSENRDAPIVVMTTEVLRNMLIEDPASLRDVDTVVFDEVHFLADRDRGTIWEESIILCLPHIRLICLSATIANAEEVAAWISQTHATIFLVRHDERPVPLEHYSYGGGGLIRIRDVNGNRVARVKEPEKRRRTRVPLWTTGDVVQSMSGRKLVPAIWFAFTRAGAEQDAERCAQSAGPNTGKRKAAVDEAIQSTLDLIPSEDRSLPQITRLTQYLDRGIGFHHAGLLAPCKELVESLFIDGHLSVVCATDTLSVGINMPARCVVISNMSRPVAGLLTPNDFSQLIGRAGRRGIDDQGAVVILPSQFTSFEAAYRQLLGPLEPIRSTFTLRYSTLLSLFEKRHGRADNPEDRLAKLVRSSLRQFQLYGEAGTAELRLADIDVRLGRLPWPHDLKGREDDLSQYVELQRRLSNLERKRTPTGKPSSRGRAKRKRARDSVEIQALRDAIRNHPFHGLVSDGAFQTEHRERIAILRERSRLQSVIARAREDREYDANRTARGVSAVLRRLGYIDRDSLLPKSAGLREVVSPAGIVLSEMYWMRVFDHVSAGALAEILSWFAHDQDRSRWNSYRHTPDLQSVYSIATSTFRRVSGLEDTQGIKLAQGPSSWFWGVAFAWCGGKSVEEITNRIEISAGDVVSALNKTIDLLDQFGGLAVRNNDLSLTQSATDARRLLNRGLVAMMRSDQSSYGNSDSTVA